MLRSGHKRLRRRFSKNGTPRTGRLTVRMKKDQTAASGWNRRLYRVTGMERGRSWPDA